MLFVLAATDLAWNTHAGLRFTGWSGPATGAGLLMLVSLVYAALARSAQIAECTSYAAMWVVFSVFAGIQTYLGATMDRPLMDDAFIRFDHLLGLDWISWIRFVRAHPVLNGVLRAAYNSLMAQIIGSIMLFALARVARRNQELLLSAIVALFATTMLSALLPALGPWVHFGYGAFDRSDTTYVAHVLALRHGNAPAFAIHEIQGIDCFPSFHTVLAVLFVYAHRGIRCSFPAVFILNGLMLFAIPSEGGHYFSDMVGGAAVAILAIVLVRATAATTNSGQTGP
jgi:hypothetical protein